MQFKKITILFFVILSFKSFGQSLPNDTVYLVDGTFITGEILNPGSENSIQLRNNAGAIIYIKNQRIEKLIIDPNRPIAKPNVVENKKFQNNFSKKKTESDLSYRNRLLAFNLFLGTPVGAFGSSSVNKNGAGGALPGFGIEARYLKKIDADLYWSLNIKYVKYGFNTKILEPTIIQQTGFAPLSFSRASWEALSFGGGINWFYPINNDFKISLSASIYFQSMKIPTINVLLNGGTGTFDEQKGAGISPDFAAKIIYKERFFLKFNFNTARISFYSASAPGQVSFVQSVRALGFGIGVFIPKIRTLN